MFIKPSGAIAATTTLAMLSVATPVLAASGPAPPTAPPPGGGTPAAATAPATGTAAADGTAHGAGPPPGALAAARAATAPLPHSPQLLRQLAGPVRGGAAAAAAGPSVRGIDVAAFQHPNHVRINWSAVAAAGYKFAAVKATEGNYYVNPWAATDLTAAKKAGLYVTAYHFAIPNVSGGAAQAGYAIRHAKYASGAHMLPLLLDIEYDPYAGIDGTNECYGLSHARMTSWIAAFVAAVRNLTGQLPVIYTTAGWWAACTGRSKSFGADPMWVAAYGFAKPPIPAGWATWTFWQYTATGTVRGVDSPGNTDLSLFNVSQVGLISPGTQHTVVGATVTLQLNALDTVAKRSLSYKATGLPPGLSISNQGAIKGVPSTPGTYHATVSAKNSSGKNGSVQFTWQVNAAAKGISEPLRPVRGIQRLCDNRRVQQRPAGRCLSDRDAAGTGKRHGLPMGPSTRQEHAIGIIGSRRKADIHRVRVCRLACGNGTAGY
jgi:GH25 family lysozyme M1 (1,4-beta-N-acetylmuramidase)